jgi:hypothetical protein
VAARPDMRGERTIGGEDAVGLPWRLEPWPPPLARAGRRLGVCRAVVESARWAMLHPRPEVSPRRMRAVALIGPEHAWPIPQALQSCAEEGLRRVLVPSALHQDVEDRSLLSDSPPEGRALPVNRPGDGFQEPLVAGRGLSMPECLRIGWAECATPLPHSFVAHRDAAGEEGLCHVPVAEPEPAIEPEAMTADRCWAAVVLVSIPR